MLIGTAIIAVLVRMFRRRGTSGPRPLSEDEKRLIWLAWTAPGHQVLMTQTFKDQGMRIVSVNGQELKDDQRPETAVRYVVALESLEARGLMKIVGPHCYALAGPGLQAAMKMG
jgi:hypothetical protein